MSRWDKSDKRAWNESEIMREFEKTIIHSIYALKDELKKKADLKQTTQDIKNLGTVAPAAADGVERVADAVQKLEGSAEDNFDEEDEEIEKAADDLILALTKLSYKLADDGDTALAYKIERVIQDIEAGFVENED